MCHLHQLPSHSLFTSDQFKDWLLASLPTVAASESDWRYTSQQSTIEHNTSSVIEPKYMLGSEAYEDGAHRMN